MPLRVYLEGDKARAAAFLKWAKSKLFMLKANMKSFSQKQGSKFYTLNGVDVFISSLYDQDEIRIVGGGVYIFVPEWQGSDFAIPRIQIFDQNSNYSRETPFSYRGEWNAPITFPSSGGSGEDGKILKNDVWMATAGPRIGSSFLALVDMPEQNTSNWYTFNYRMSFDVAYYDNYLYSTNWWGSVHKFTKDVVFLSGEYLTDKVAYGEPYNSETIYLQGRRVTYENKRYEAIKLTKGNLPTDTNYWAEVIYTGGGKALEQIAIGGDKIAISANFKSNLKWVYFFDIDFNYLFDVSLLPVWTTGSQGVEIYGDKVFVAWSGEITEPQTSYYGIWEYNLSDGVFTAAFYDDETLGEFAQSLAAYDGILYAADTRKDQIVKYDIATRKIIGKIDLTNIMLTDTEPRIPADISPRGLAVGKSGIWITAMRWDGSLHPKLPVKLYHLDLNGNLIREIGSYGTGKSQFKAPMSVALREVA